MAKKKITPQVLTSVLKDGPRSNRELRADLGLSTEKYDPRLDRKLQELRKSGQIQLVNGRWALHTIEPCPTCKGRGWVQK